MPSPDLRGYSDLVLVDRDEYAIAEDAWDAASARMPGIVRRPGLIADAMIAAHARIAAWRAMTVNQVVPGTVETLLRLLQIRQGIGTAPTATARITVVNNAGHVIPAGTRLRLTVGSTIVDFTTDAVLEVQPGDTEDVIEITGTARTASVNGTPVNTTLQVLDPLFSVESAKLETAVAGGIDPESDEDWIARATGVFALYTQTLLHAEQFEQRSLQLSVEDLAPVYRARGLNRYDPGQAGAVGTHPGHVTVAVLGAGGLALSAGQKAVVLADLVAKGSADLIVHVVDANVTDVPVTVTVKRLAGWTDAEVQAAVAAEVQAYLSPDTWDWAGGVYRNELIALIDTVEGVDRVVTLATPAADVTLTGVAPLADTAMVAGDVTVQAP